MFTYPVSENPRALVVGDFNNDGKLDVAMADFTSNITVLFEGNGDGTFTYEDTGPDPEHLQESDNTLAAADFNGDLSSTLPPARTTAGWS
ncbi:MAG: VCBS repeat-containing protein [Solirubrobacterales bacterium]|nr:VCBS repeat-containing protein [Solirubrobacterales bacterium]